MGMLQEMWCHWLCMQVDSRLGRALESVKWDGLRIAGRNEWGNRLDPALRANLQNRNVDMRSLHHFVNTIRNKMCHDTDLLDHLMDQFPGSDRLLR